MTTINDEAVSKLTVRIKNKETNKTIGSGLLYYHESLRDLLYVITASHCLFKDRDAFTRPINSIIIDFLDPSSNSYHSFQHEVDFTLLNTDVNKDIAVLVLQKSDILKLIKKIPEIKVLKVRNSFKDFIVKGFPEATYGKELAVLYPTWLQTTTEVEKFQLQLNENYDSYSTQGFSGAGVFLLANKQVYLFGIFTRFRPEDRGKVIYCQYIETVNELLEQNFLPALTVTYNGEFGMTQNFFRRQVESSIKNLGPRFSEELNFQLPIAQRFSDITRDNNFTKRFYNTFDNWLDSRSIRRSENHVSLKEIEEELNSFKEHVQNWIEAVDITLCQPLELNVITQRLRDFEEIIDKKNDELYELQYEKSKLNKEKDNPYARKPYDSEISRLSEISSSNRTLNRSLSNNFNLKLVNSPLLLLNGIAGSGKSHLFGDIANERIKKNLPTVLLLGQHFSKDKTIWENILRLTELACQNSTEFLSGLNKIGEQLNSRVLILIDAINEGDAKERWRNELSGFIGDVEHYPFIGLSISIRSTYFDSVVPKQVKENNKITMLTHEGFKGNEYNALKLFCDFHGLKAPTFPLLSPEFGNPLFLQLICDAVKKTKEKVFPQGVQGINEIFDYYLEALKDKIQNIRIEYTTKPKLVEKAIELVSKTCFEQDKGRLLKLEDADSLFALEFPNTPYLLHDLIQENVFIKNISRDYEKNADEEVIYFSYERFGDFIITKEILSKLDTKAKVLESFKEEAQLGKLIEDNFWEYDGLLETFAILLPELYDLELFEVYNWIFEKWQKFNSKKPSLNNHEFNHERFRIHEKMQSISRKVLNSLNWRRIDSMDEEKLIKWFNSDNCTTDYDSYLFKLVELSVISNHPFNGERLYKIFSNMNMPTRDSFWQQHLSFYSSNDDDGNAFPIRRLINWAWTYGISDKVDSKTTKLAAVTLTWVLSSTNSVLRDQTTKALVNLLEQQPEALLYVLKKYEKCDDLYIRERLFSIAYGCILRTSLPELIKEVAKYCYKTIFKKGAPPTHILLRDYGRNIMEYALFKRISFKIDQDLIRPPYNSPMPHLPRNEGEIKIKRLDSKEKGFKENYGYDHNQIFYTMFGDDFGYKTVKYVLDDFMEYSYTFDVECKEYFRSLKPKQRKLIKTIISFNESQGIWLRNKDRLLDNFYTEEKFNESLKSIDESLEMGQEFLKTEFSETQRNYINSKIIPHYLAKSRSKTGNWNHISIEPIKCWMIERAFQLGFDAELHGRFDSTVGEHRRHWMQNTSRISKKYLLIAYYEILAMIADNYEFNRQSYSYKGNHKYKGPWQLYLRDIDPAYVTRDPVEHDEDDIDKLGIIEDKQYWYSTIQYNQWQQSNENWIENMADLPNPKYILEKNDDQGNPWLHLNHFIEWEEPKPIGKDKYQIKLKRMWYLVNGYLIKKEHKSRILKYLDGKHFWGRWMPEPNDNINQLFNRESYWSPAYQKENKWNTIEETNYKVVVATSYAKGTLEKDKSGANIAYNIPCKSIFDGMDLQYSKLDGDFLNSSGKLMATNINPKGVLIKKKEFVDFLSKNNLEIFWTVLGEKQAFSSLGGDNGKNYFMEYSGLYFMEDLEIKGTINPFGRTI